MVIGTTGLVLSVETSTSTGSLALAENQKILNSKCWTSEGSHSDVITLALQSVLGETNTTLRDLSAITLGVGPGSFTGIRIGVNLAKGLAYSLNLPVYELSSLLSCSGPAAIQGYRTIFAGMKAFRNLFYCSKYEVHDSGCLTTLLPETAFTLDQIEPWIENCDCVVGDAADFLAKQFSNLQKPLFSQGAAPAATNHMDLLSLQTKDSCPEPISPKVWNQVSPLYVRASEAEEQFKKL